jgi:hypothetical protein
MALYKLILQGGVQRTSDGAFIPTVAGNRDWQAYQAWLALGNTADAADPPPPPTQDQIDATAANAYTKLNALKNMTPAQVQAWVTGNVTNLAQAQDAIMTLAIAVSILARRL